MTRVLLVHGAFHGAWCWDRLVPELSSRGIEAEAIELPFTTPEADADAAAEAIERLAADGDQVVAVGHSFGGAVLSRGGHKADHLVYLTALMVEADEVPDMGESPGLAALSLEGEVAHVDPSGATAAFYHRCAPEDAAWATDHLREMPTALLVSGRVDQPAWQTVPSTYIICTDDQIISPSGQANMARHAGSSVSIDSDHSPFLACPAELADLLEKIVETVQPA